jgi:hypothetical protein
MTRNPMIAALLGIGLLANPASAQTVDQRHASQDRRIATGAASGRLTSGEEHRVEHQQASIDAQESRMRARNGGHLAASQRGRLQRRESNASRHIHNAKHD